MSFQETEKIIADISEVVYKRLYKTDSLMIWYGEYDKQFKRIDDMKCPRKTFYVQFPEAF